MELIDGVERNREAPDTFEIPSDEEKAAVKEGMFVKLGFVLSGVDGPSAERMWVKVTGGNIGMLANDPVFAPMMYGCKVEFKPENILSIQT